MADGRRSVDEGDEATRRRGLEGMQGARGNLRDAGRHVIISAHGI